MMPDTEVIRESLLPILTDHEKRVLVLILSIEGTVQGFPDTPRKLYNVTRAWARFMSLDPYHVKFNRQVEATMTEEDKKPFMWKDGVIPGEWLIQQIQNTCEWMPSPVAAREIYCREFRPLDGLTMDKIPEVGRRSKSAED